MRNLSIYLIAPFLLLLTACGTNAEDAKEFNDKIIQVQRNVLEAENDFINAVSNNKQEEIDQAYNTFLNTINESIKKVEEMEGHSKFDNFRKAALDFLKTYKAVTGKEYARAIEIAKIPDEKYTQEDDDELMQLSEIIDKKLQDAINEFGKAQEKFAKEWELNLVEGEEKIKKE